MKQLLSSLLIVLIATTANCQDVINLRHISDSLYSRGDIRGCLKTINNIPAGSMEHADYRRQLDCMNLLGMKDETVECGKNIIRLFPDDAETIADIASYYNNRNDSAMVRIALSYTQPYLQRDSTHIYVLRQQAKAHYLLEEWQTATDEYQRLLQLGDSTFTVLYNLGRCYYIADELPIKAYKLMLKAAEIKEFKDGNSLSQLGYICIDMGLYEKGAYYLKLAEEALMPSQKLMSSLYGNMEKGFVQCSKYDEAISALERHITFIPTAYYVYYKLAQVYKLKKDFDNEAFYLHEFLKHSTTDDKNLNSMREMASKRLKELKI